MGLAIVELHQCSKRNMARAELENVADFAPLETAMMAAEPARHFQPVLRVIKLDKVSFVSQM